MGTSDQRAKFSGRRVTLNLQILDRTIRGGFLFGEKSQFWKVVEESACVQPGSAASKYAFISLT